MPESKDPEVFRLPMLLQGICWRIHWWTVLGLLSCAPAELGIFTSSQSGRDSLRQRRNF